MLNLGACRRPPAPNLVLSQPHAPLQRPALQRKPLPAAQALPLAAPGLRSGHRRRQQRAVSALPNTGAGAASVEVPPIGVAEEHREQRKRGLAAVLSPLSDRRANGKLLALCASQSLASVATLMHELYLPIYLTDQLGCSHTQVGNLQGAAQLLSKAAGAASGTLADLVSPARMVILGAALTAASKPMYAAAGGVAALGGTTACLYWLAFAKIFDRVAKGIREAPSKALVGELAASSGDSPAAAFSLRQSLGVAGGLVGAGVASLALRLTHRSYTAVFALSVVPALLALALLAAAFGPGSAAGKEAAATYDEDAAGGNGAAGPPLAAQRRLSLGAKARALSGALRPAYWQALAVVVILYMARFSEGFPMLRARAFIDSQALPLLMAVVGVTTAALAPLAGLRAKASVGARNRVLLWGIAALVGADLCFAFTASVQGMLLGAALLGMHMASTHGVSVAMLSSYIPAQPVPGLGRVSGTIWSLTDMCLGAVLGLSNFVAGRLNDASLAAGRGATGCFLGGAVACAASAAALLAFSTWGSLGRDDALQAAAKPAAVAA